MSRLLFLFPTSFGYQNWPMVGEPCSQCDLGLIQQRAGMRTCSWCGRSHYSLKSVAFSELKIGDRFYPSSSSIKDLQLYIKVKNEWTKDNIKLANGSSYSGSCGPDAGCIKEKDCELA